MNFTPGAPSRDDIDAMKRLMNIVVSTPSATSSPDTILPRTNITESKMNTNREPARPAVMSSSIGVPSGADVDMMKKFLNICNTPVSKTASVLAEEAKYDAGINEMMSTRKTAQGVQIAEYLIETRIKDGTTNQKLYSIKNENTGKNIIDDLVIPEAARAIIKHLRAGRLFEDAKIQEVLDLEETYRRNHADAMRFKQRYNRCVELGESEAGDIFNSRYQVARANALVAHDQIKSLLESIR